MHVFGIIKYAGFWIVGRSIQNGIHNYPLNQHDQRFFFILLSVSTEMKFPDSLYSFDRQSNCHVPIDHAWHTWHAWHAWQHVWHVWQHAWYFLTVASCRKILLWENKNLRGGSANLLGENEEKTKVKKGNRFKGGCEAIWRTKQNRRSNYHEWSFLFVMRQISMAVFLYVQYIKGS